MCVDLSTKELTRKRNGAESADFSDRHAALHVAKNVPVIIALPRVQARLRFFVARATVRRCPVRKVDRRVYNPVRRSASGYSINAFNHFAKTNNE